MSKLAVKAAVLKEQVAKQKAGVEKVYPAVFEQESITMKDIKLADLKASTFDRFEVPLDAENTVRAGFFRGTPKDLDTYDLAFCKNTREFEVNGTTFPKGEWYAFKLVEPA
jgi:hypothetical protein